MQHCIAKYGFQYWWVILLLGLAGAVLGVLGLRNPDVTALTLSTFIGIGIILIGVGYIVAVWGVNKFEKQVKQQVDQISNAINNAQ